MRANRRDERRRNHERRGEPVLPLLLIYSGSLRLLECNRAPHHSRFAAPSAATKTVGPTITRACLHTLERDITCPSTPAPPQVAALAASATACL